MNESHSGNSIVFSAGRALYDLFVFHAAYMIYKSPVLLLLVLLLPFISLLIDRKEIKLAAFNIQPLLSVLICAGIFYTHHFLSLFAGGYSLQGRVFNISLFIAFIAVAFILINCLVYFNLKLTFNLKFLKLILLFVFINFLFSDNSRMVIGELTRTLPTLKKELNHRYALIGDAKQNNKTAVEVPRVNIPTQLFNLNKDSMTYNSPKYLREISLYYKIDVKLQN
jgi:FlaA1/EpsC-like NDP-sugar epimerase